MLRDETTAEELYASAPESLRRLLRANEVPRRRRRAGVGGKQTPPGRRRSLPTNTTRASRCRNNRLRGRRRRGRRRRGRLPATRRHRRSALARGGSVDGGFFGVGWRRRAARRFSVARAASWMASPTRDGGVGDARPAEASGWRTGGGRGIDARRGARDAMAAGAMRAFEDLQAQFAARAGAGGWGWARATGTGTGLRGDDGDDGG